MCLFSDAMDNQSRTRLRRTLAVTVLLLVGLSFLMRLPHLQPGPEADLFDFVRGLMVGIALALSFGVLTLCVRRPRIDS